MRSSSLSSLGFLAFGFAIAVAAACGGASNTDLLGGGGHASSSSSGSSSSGSGSGGGSGSSSGNTSSSGSGSGGSSGGMPDASMADVNSVDVVQPMETGPTGPAVLCPVQGQPMTCNQGDVCCVTGNAAAGTQMDACQHQGQACTGGAIVRCASSADCNKGEVCCGQKDTTMMMYTEVACRQSCTGTGQVTFCDPQAATSDCTQPTAPNCVQSTLLQGYNVCGP